MFWESFKDKNLQTIIVNKTTKRRSSRRSNRVRERATETFREATEMFREAPEIFRELFQDRNLQTSKVNKTPNRRSSRRSNSVRERAMETFWEVREMFREAREMF